MKFYPVLSLFFDRIIKHPYLVMFLLVLIIAPLAYNVRNFEIDASADTLLLEGDKDLLYSQTIDERYGSQSFLIVTFNPETDLFDSENLDTLSALVDNLRSVKGVSSVLSILDVPLLQSPPLELKELTSELPTLSSSEVNKQLAREELSGSPVYEDLLLSSDANTTGILIYLSRDETLNQLLTRRTELNRIEDERPLTKDEQAQLERLENKIDGLREIKREENHQMIVRIRHILDQYRNAGELFLGGLDMIADDMITYIKNDLKVFGTSVLLLLIVALGSIFRRFRWVILPILCCLVSVLCMAGLLGLLGLEVTVVSSNFISLQLIMTLAIVIHLIVRYREFDTNCPDEQHPLLIRRTLMAKFNPCFFMVVTTIAGFASLIFSRILPVINFGWMMMAGLIVSFLVTFLLFPLTIALLPKEKVRPLKKKRFALTSILAKFTDQHKVVIAFMTLFIFALSIWGITRLKVENSFINYFKQDSEIYQGLELIDRKLGGTTPLDVIVDFPKDENDAVTGNFTNEQDAVFDEFEEFELEQDSEKYWFTAHKIETIKNIHNYLQDLPATGKVLSLASLIRIAEKLNKDRSLDSFDLALLYNETPEKFKDLLLEPYVSIEHSQVRFWVRIIDSKEDLRRNELLKTMRSDLVRQLDTSEDNVHLAGMLVLYNNMLQSLFDSQVKTFGITSLILTFMFFILFRSLKVAVIIMIPSTLPVAVVLGIMGLFDIPLDMMTITIAAIGIGIAVDDAIHYVHRFKHEIENDYDYTKTMYRCHGSIGFAMYYTTITITIGFSILVFSNFIPNIYFGLLTGITMITALIADLTLLPILLILFKPFGKNV